MEITRFYMIPIKQSNGLMENIQTVLIPNASHMLLYEKTELVNSHILNFLSGDRQTGQ
jgi:pimeloyl-ACP methyl ester carboxylesterase